MIHNIEQSQNNYLNYYRKYCTKENVLSPRQFEPVENL